MPPMIRAAACILSSLFLTSCVKPTLELCGDSRPWTHDQQWFAGFHPSGCQKVREEAEEQQRQERVAREAVEEEKNRKLLAEASEAAREREKVVKEMARTGQLPPPTEQERRQGFRLVDPLDVYKAGIVMIPCPMLARSAYEVAARRDAGRSPAYFEGMFSKTSGMSVSQMAAADLMLRMVHDIYNSHISPLEAADRARRFCGWPPMH